MESKAPPEAPSFALQPWRNPVLILSTGREPGSPISGGKILEYRYKLCGAEGIYQGGEGHITIKRGHSVGFNQRRGHYGLEYIRIVYNTTYYCRFHKRFPLKEPKRHFYPIRNVFEFSIPEFQPVGRCRGPLPWRCPAPSAS